MTIKTYNVDRQTPDSAATATALFSGIKTNFYTLGYDSNIRLGSAKSAKNAKQLTSILDWGQSAGKRTGCSEKLIMINLISYNFAHEILLFYLLLKLLIKFN